VSVESNHHSRVGAKRHRPNQRWGRVIITLMLILLPVLAWSTWSAYERYGPIDPEEEAPRVIADSPVYVVILGVDERGDDECGDQHSRIRPDWTG